MKLQAGPTMKRCAPLALALLLCATGASAQMFKWVDAKGVVHYSDKPPVEKESKVELKTFSQGGGIDMPYELAQAMKNSPVTLYTTAPCDACDLGRALLRERGIPFSEKTVNSNDDQQKLSAAGSRGQLPLLLVGAARLIGFEAGAWNNALGNAAYPAQKVLPASYQYPVAQAAAPAPPPAPARPPARDAALEQAAEAARRAKAAADAPPGFQF